MNFLQVLSDYGKSSVLHVPNAGEMFLDADYYFEMAPY